MFSNTQEFKQYLKDARSYDQDRLLAAQRSVRWAWAIAGVSALLAGSSILAVAALTPLHSVEPFVIRVDEATGVPEVMSALSDGTETYSDATSKYFLATYVRTREGYSYAARDTIFNTVQLFSDDAEKKEFEASYNGSNPESPQYRYGTNAKAEVKIRSVSFLDDGLAQVRYYRLDTQNNKPDIIRSPWVSTISYIFDKDAEMSSQDRLTNPLGFIVTDYKSDPEVIQ